MAGRDAAMTMGRELWQNAAMAKRDIAVSFLKNAAAGRVREAYEHVDAGFRHHNPAFAGDAASLSQAMEANARAHPQKVFEIQRVLEDGDLVAVHSHVRQQPHDRGAAVVHIFRFTGNRIVELWDVGQPVPEQSINGNGMF